MSVNIEGDRKVGAFTDFVACDQEPMLLHAAMIRSDSEVQHLEPSDAFPKMTSTHRFDSAQSPRLVVSRTSCDHEAEATSCRL